MRSVLLILILAVTPWVSASPLSTPAAAVQSSAQHQDPGPWERMTYWVLAQQRALHRKLAVGMEAVQQAPTLANTLALVLVGFLYGVFHAAGPGHGKAVIATYVLTHREHLKRALALSWASSLMQGITAITLVVAVVVVAERMARDALGQVRTLEQASFALVAAVGAWLVFRALRGLWRLRRTQPRTGANGQHPEHGHGHGHGHGHDGPGHDPACGCGHAHHITPDQAARNRSLGAMIGTVVAVGIRPCTGAILVLAVANMLGLWLAGLAAVIAMSVGTAITVSVLAVLAVQARQWTGRLAGSQGQHSLAWARTAQVVALAGGLLIFSLGISLLGAGLHAPAHPLGI